MCLLNTSGFRCVQTIGLKHITLIMVMVRTSISTILQIISFRLETIQSKTSFMHGTHVEKIFLCSSRNLTKFSSKFCKFLITSTNCKTEVSNIVYFP